MFQVDVIRSGLLASAVVEGDAGDGASHASHFLCGVNLLRECVIVIGIGRQILVCGRSRTDLEVFNIDLPKVGHKGGIARYDEAVVRVGGNHLADFRPIEEWQIAVRRGAEGTGGAAFVGSAAAHRAAARRIGRDGNLARTRPHDVAEAAPVHRSISF